jgi:hypothetical protein
VSHLRDITNQQIGKLTARWPVGFNKQKQAVWLFSCACGNSCVVSSHNFLRQHSKSCGCIRKDRTTSKLFKHGWATKGSRRPEYMAFQSAKRRCTNPHCKDYKDYGGRGIEFRFAGFEAFLLELGPKPNPELTVDRIDNDGHYEAGNVRWATMMEQRHNRRPTATSPPPSK